MSRVVIITPFGHCVKMAAKLGPVPGRCCEHASVSVR